MNVQDLGNGNDLETQYEPQGWMREPEHSFTHVLTGKGTHYVDGKEVTREEYDSVLTAQVNADKEARKEREFDSPDDAFTYAATLQDGIVLDWGRSYAAMERKGLEIGFVVEPYDQPIVTPQDLLVKAGPRFILARRDPKGSRFGGCSTDFTDSSKSWSEDEVDVIHDGTGNYSAGQRLRVKVMGAMGARSHVGQNWRMKLFKPEDVIAILPPYEQVSDL